MGPFPWAEAMRFGLGVLKLSPTAFWAMTPLELARAHEGVFGQRGPALGRAGLEALMAQFPDREPGDG